MTFDMTENLRKELYGLTNESVKDFENYTLTFNLGTNKDKAKALVEAMFDCDDETWHDQNDRHMLYNQMMSLGVKFQKEIVPTVWDLGTNYQQIVEDKKWFDMLKEEGAEEGIEPADELGGSC
tara:strand:+ start:337 stop:705 length:369 start_codon:yes stop_codon:yes gene_type:complete